MLVKPGLERFLANLADYVGEKKIGLITNHSAVDSRLRSGLKLLTKTGKVGALFGLEHGVRGNVQAGEQVKSVVDSKTGLPIFSLYGETRRPTAEMVADIDCLVFDLQDVGCRFYTYLYSLLYCLEAAAQFNLPIFVLDRPNPLGGEIVSGNILKEEFISFVGYPLPIRYGLTIGEIALYFNETRAIQADLTVVKLAGWQRGFYWEATGLNWVAPSPNMPTAQTALVYPGTCLLEGTNLSEGRGTALPFEIIGAPWLDGEMLAERLNKQKLPGVIFRPAYFTPSFSKYAGELCKGVQLHVTAAAKFDPIRAAVKLLGAVAANYEEFEFLAPPGRRFFFDLLAGDNKLRLLLEAGDWAGLEDLLQEWEQEAGKFARDRREFFLY